MAPTAPPAEVALVPLVRAHQLGLAQHMSVDRVLELLAGGAVLEVEVGVEGIELEEVTVRTVALGRGRPRVPRTAEAVRALAGRRHVLFDAAGLRVDVPGEPVREVAGGRVGVVDDQGERPRSLGNEVPAQRWRGPLAVRRMAFRNRLAVVEGRAGELEVGHRVSASRAPSRQTPGDGS